MDIWALLVIKVSDNYTGIAGIPVRWIVFAEMQLNIPIWAPLKQRKWTNCLPGSVEFRYRMPILTINQGELYHVRWIKIVSLYALQIVRFFSHYFIEMYFYSACTRRRMVPRIKYRHMWSRITASG